VVKNKGVSGCVKKKSLTENHGERINYRGDDSRSRAMKKKKLHEEE
jgi:hypothetical protein